MSIPLQNYEKSLGFLYGLLQIFLLGPVAQLINNYLQLPQWALNCALFGLNFLCMSAIFHRFLLLSLKAAAKHIGATLLWAAVCLIGYYLLVLGWGWLCLYISPEYTNLNDASMGQYVQQGGLYLSLATVLLVPVAEELLFRGLLFCGLYRQCPSAAWIVSTVFFSLVHILGFVGLYNPLHLLLAFIQYLPAGFFLCLAYRRTGTIITPILMHIVINGIGVLLVR